MGDIAWDVPANLFQHDGSYAVADAIGPGDRSHWLRAADYRFDIPTFATVTGIEVTWFRSGDQLIVDSGVRIAKRGTFVGEDKAIGTEWGFESFGIYGGFDDLWGTTWSPEDVNDPGFGTALSVGYGDSAGNAAAYVDTARITVTFEVECK